MMNSVIPCVRFVLAAMFSHEMCLPSSVLLILYSLGCVGQVFLVGVCVFLFRVVVALFVCLGRCLCPYLFQFSVCVCVVLCGMFRY